LIHGSDWILSAASFHLIHGSDWILSAASFHFIHGSDWILSAASFHFIHDSASVVIALSSHLWFLLNCCCFPNWVDSSWIIPFPSYPIHGFVEWLLQQLWSRDSDLVLRMWRQSRSIHVTSSRTQWTRYYIPSSSRTACLPVCACFLCSCDVIVRVLDQGWASICTGGAGRAYMLVAKCQWPPRHNPYFSL
jgi:hypothetical protein